MRMRDMLRYQQPQFVVVYKVAEDTALEKVVDKGTVWTSSSDVDYTMKVEANGLKPFTTYYYQFSKDKLEKM
ncbi:hypothetical protein BDD12DRAFT_897584 [Trichophaea hybrida]|nr:hypothetical protein BDD12DRAFT_897584 [Trichophaea hybrida]